MFSTTLHCENNNNVIGEATIQKIKMHNKLTCTNKQSTINSVHLIETFALSGCGTYF